MKHMRPFKNAMLLRSIDPCIRQHNACIKRKIAAVLAKSVYFKPSDYEKCSTSVLSYFPHEDEIQVNVIEVHPHSFQRTQALAFGESNTIFILGSQTALDPCAKANSVLAENAIEMARSHCKADKILGVVDLLIDGEDYIGW